MSESDPLHARGGFYASYIRPIYRRERDFRWAMWVLLAQVLIFIARGLLRSFSGRIEACLGTAALCFMLFCGSRIRRSFVHRRKRRGYLNPSLLITNYQISYQANSDWRGGTFHFVIVVKPLEEGVLFFNKRHRWTGGGGCTIIPQEGLTEVPKPELDSNGIWEKLTLPFDEFLHVGKPKRIRFKIEAADPTAVASNILSKTIDDNFLEDCLQLTVILPTSHDIACHSEHFRYYSDQHPHIHQLTFDIQSGVIRWSPEQIKFGHKYQISWSKGAKAKQGKAVGVNWSAKDRKKHKRRNYR